MAHLRFLNLGILCPVLALGAASALSPAENQLLESIQANTMKGHISFLASDLLEGRDTPSRGLDLAGEYIASQFRRFGLEPAGADGSYFQTAPYLKITQPMDGFRIRLGAASGKAWESSGAKLAVIAHRAVQAAELEVVKVSIADENTPLPAKEAIRGKALLLVLTTQLRTPAILARREALLAMGPAVVVGPGFTVTPAFRLREASAAPSATPPVITVSDSDFTKVAAELPEGATGAKLSVHIAAPLEEPVQLRNVAAKLAGGDAALKNKFVLLTAHYDHIGLLPGSGEGDRINNGANDDASGVSTVLALAEAFSSMKAKPKRSLLFMTYFGEEKGLLGSRYYASHPLVPLRNTAANLNFEHMGRSDDNEGSRVGKITATGFDYTTLGDVIVEAGKATGVEAWKHEKYSDMFFAHSDNQALADMGIPALSMSVAFLFPDYHRPGDHWDKIDYPNLERAARTAALLVERIANAQAPPQWIESNPKVEKYIKAYKALHGAAPSTN